MRPVTGKKVKPTNDGGAVHGHLLHCKYFPSFYSLNSLSHESKKYLLEIHETFVIMRDKPSLNRNISSSPLYQFDQVS